jgi:hypothetical protein
MKIIKTSFIITLLFTSIAFTSPAQTLDTKKMMQEMYHADSLFWEAYNQCDVDKMATFFTDDLEFYHDNGGLTTPKSAFVAEVRKGLCGTENWRLKREPLEGTVELCPIKNYGGLITGEHIFYIIENGNEPRLDGYGKFADLWVYKDNQWKMSRVLSYDHGPAPFINKRREVTLTPAQLKPLTGKFESPKSGQVSITAEDNSLQVEAGDFKVVLYPASESTFFAKDQDLQFEFVKENKKFTKVIITEKGKVTDECKRTK